MNRHRHSSTLRRSDKIEYELASAGRSRAGLGYADACPCRWSSLGVVSFCGRNGCQVEVLGVFQLGVCAKRLIEHFVSLSLSTRSIGHGFFDADDLMALRALAEAMTGAIHFISWSKPTYIGQFWSCHMASFPQVVALRQAFESDLLNGQMSVHRHFSATRNRMRADAETNQVLVRAMQSALTPRILPLGASSSFFPKPTGRLRTALGGYFRRPQSSKKVRMRRSVRGWIKPR
jgi:hypothetical protein